MIPDDLYIWLLKYFVHQTAGEEFLLELEDKLMDEIWKHHDGEPQFPYFELEQFGYKLVDKSLEDNDFPYFS